MSQIQKAQQAAPAQVRKSRKKSPTVNGDRQLAAVVNHAQSVVKTTAQVSAEIIAAVPAAIEYETAVLVESMRPEIDGAIAATVAAIEAETVAAKQSSRDKANEFFTRYGLEEMK
jgi:hypothetical protein